MATITTRAGKGAALTHQEVDANFTGLNTELGQKEVATNKGAANGYASLDAAGKVPAAQLPSYVDDVLEYANLASFPATGETGKIYVTVDTNKTYRWSGSAYVEISASPGTTDSITEGSTNLYFTNARARSAISASGSLSYNSSTGVMSYTQPTNVSSFTNDAGYITSSATITGNAATATKLQTGRTISLTGDVTGTSVAFDGSAALSFAATLANSGVAAGTYTKVTVDAKGRVTTGASLASGDLPTYTGTITSSQVTTALGFTPLSTTGKAADADKVDGIDSTQIVYGATGAASNQLAATQNVYELGQYKAGFWDVSGGSWTPTSDWYWGATFAHGGNSSSYNFSGQLAFLIGGGGNNLYARTIGGGTPSGWARLLSSGNFNSYSPTLTGTGASGTWGINITGNAASASAVAWGNVSSKPSAIMYYQGFTLDANTMESNATGFSYAVNSPHVGPIVRFSADGSYDLWLNAPYSGSGNSLSFRTRNGDAATLNPWRAVLHDGNYTSYSPSLTGSGASGTWGINVTGESRSVNLGGTGHTITSSSWAGGGGYHGYTYNGGNFRFGFSSTGGVVDVYADGNFYATDNSYLVLHAANYSSYALPLSGGTVSGSITVSGQWVNTGTGGANTGVAVYHGSGSGDYGVIRFYQAGTNSQAIHSFSTAWQSGTLAGASAGAINFWGSNGVTFGAWNNVDAYIASGGTFWARANVTAYSDERVKANWRHLDDGFLVKLSSVKSGIYDRTDAEITQVGVSAQSLRDVLPHAVIESDNGDLSVAYGNAALVSAVELAKEFVALKHKVAELEARVH